MAEWAEGYRQFWDASYDRLDTYLETLKAKEQHDDDDEQDRRDTFTTPSDLEIRATRRFDAPRELVFDAHTSPEHLPHWMSGPSGWTMTVCEIDLRPGGAWRFAWRKEDGAEMELTGVYREVARPERLVNTESWGPDWPDTVNTLSDRGRRRHHDGLDARSTRRSRRATPHSAPG